MPMPEGSQLDFGFNPILTNIGINYIPKLTDKFIGQSVFPVIPSAVESGTYNIWNVGDFLRRNGKEIANYEAVPLGGFSTGQGTFSVKNWGVGTPWTNRDLAKARRGGMTDQQFKNLKAKWVTTQGMLELEFRIRDLIQTTTNWTTTIAGVASGATPGSTFVRWDQAGSTPVDDMDYYRRVMRQLTGVTPNTMIIPDEVMIALRKNPQIIARVTPGFYSAGRDVPLEVDDEHIRKLLKVDTLLTPLSMYNSAAEGQTADLVDIWGRTMWLGYVESDANPMAPTAGAQISWTGDSSNGLPAGMGNGAGPENMGSVQNDMGLFLREYPDLPRAAMIIEGMLWRSPVVMAPAMGMTWTVPITP